MAGAGRGGRLMAVGLCVVGIASAAWGSAWASGFASDKPATAAPVAPVIPAVGAPASAPPAGPIAPISPDMAKSLVIGASVSDGFGAQVRLKIPAKTETLADGTVREVAPAADRMRTVRLSDALRAVASSETAPEHRASMLFFTSANRVSQSQGDVAAAKSREDGQGVVFAVDYLFWHVYGFMPEAQRLTMLETGLTRLDKIKGVLVIGDIPDMRHATLMLRPVQSPTVETHAKANARISEWLASKPRVVCVPLRAMILGVRSDAIVMLGGTQYKGEDAAALLTGDQLHASDKGLVALAQECFVQLRAKGLLAKDFAWQTDAAAARTTLQKNLSK